MDKVLLEGLVCQAHVGVPAEERAKPQKILVDLELGLDLSKAGRNDRVQETVDYAAVAHEVKKLVEERSFILVEAVAEGAAGMILARFPVQQVTVRVRKFSVPGTSSVGVKVKRGQTPLRQKGSDPKRA